MTTIAMSAAAQAAADAPRRATPPRLLLRFLTEWSQPNGCGYMQGDVAGFPPELAKTLIACGIAVDDEKPPLASPACASAGSKHDGCAIVRFKMPWSMYQVGDEAGFDIATVRWLQAKGVGEPVEQPPLIQRKLASLRAEIAKRVKLLD